MKRSKAFVLVEILTGMVLQAGFIIVLCTSFYLMLSFYTRTQQVLNARQRGEKVIAYVNARIRNAGLGLGECSSSSEIRDALYNLKSSMLEGKNLTLPVSVTSGNWNFKAKNSNNKFTGNRLTLLYTQRASDRKLIIRTIESPDKSGSNCALTLSADTSLHNVSADVGFILKKNNDYSNSEFYKKGDASTRLLCLNSYTVLAGTGRPLFICEDINTSNGKFKLQSFNAYETNIYPGDELLYLKCERMFAENQNFKFMRFKTNSWGDKIPSEAGILEIYFELDASNNILDMYVLASGGINDSGNTQKPSAWPSDFWKSDYENYTVYVSRASWKLHNISFTGDKWN